MLLDLPHHINTSMFGVYDGHGGDGASRFCSQVYGPEHEGVCCIHIKYCIIALYEFANIYIHPLLIFHTIAF